MRILNKLLFATLTFFAGQISAAPIAIGPYAFDTDAGATSASFSGGVFENVPGAITDTFDNTYIRGTSSNSAVSLTFDNIALSNQAGNDLAFFFLFADNTVSVDINGTNSGPLNSSQLFVNDDPLINPGPGGEKYVVIDILLPNGDLAFTDLSVIFIDLENFGIALNQSITNIDINLGNNTSLMNYAIGMNPAVIEPPVVIPIPAPILLFLSGLTVFGLFQRRK